MGARSKLHQRHSFGARLLAGGLSLAAIVSIRPAYSDPADIFSIAAPTIGAEAPKAAAIADGDASVATQTGALTYAFQITVPPGRQGAQPSIALSYSSQAPLYGGLAAGWSLSGLPMIALDTSRGRLRNTGFSTPMRQFSTTLSGGRELIPVDEPRPEGAAAFRAQGDGSFIRYQKMGSGSFPWRALSPDGTTYVFGDSANVGDCTIVSDEYAPITSSSDSFGNVVDYFWEKGVTDECRIKGIAWGRNDEAQVAHFAAIQFVYAAVPPACAGSPVNSQTSFRSGRKIVSGASQLDAIRITAFAPRSGTVDQVIAPGLNAVHTRVVQLGYDASRASCSTDHASFRALNSITESASGVDAKAVELPPITFKYGSPSLLYLAQPATPFVPWAAATLAGQPQHNLGWGYRPRGSNAWPTVEAMMVDLDGDGLIDRLTNEPYLENGKVRFCRARWYRNLGSAHAGAGQFQPAGYIEIPTLKWATDSDVYSTTPWLGGTAAGVNTSTGALERCALNYQRTGYINSDDGGVAGFCSNGGTCEKTADMTSGRCSDGSDCYPAKNGTPTNTLWSWRWFDIDGDGKTDLIGSPTRGGLNSYNLRWAPLSVVPSLGWPTFEPPIFGIRTRDEEDRGFPLCPTEPDGSPRIFTAYPSDPNQPYTMCNGHFPWFVYKNHGQGRFGRTRARGGSTHPHATWGNEPDEVIYQPIPLESSSGDSSITVNPVGETQGVFDIDGDGFADAVKQNGTDWSVFLNDGEGRLRPAENDSPYSFATGTQLFLFRTTSQPNTVTAPQSVSGLNDVNGDGYIDHWEAALGETTATITLSDGVQFRSDSVYSTQKPGADAAAEVAEGEIRNNFICRGTRTDTRRPIDTDGDGRIDIVTPSVFGSTELPQVAFNQGGVFTEATRIPELGSSVPGALNAAMLHSTIVRTDADENPCEATNPTWEIRSDMVDLDGDGIPEAIDFGPADASSQVMRSARIAGLASQPRLLVEIDNNRGSKTVVSYGSMNSAAVEQHPELGHATPHTQWVVQSVVTTDELAGTTSTTSYRYKSPRFHPDNRGKYGFRGFDEVDTTMPSGAHSIQRYSYDPDWSGRLEVSMLVASSSVSTEDNGPRTIDVTTWARRALFDDAVESFHVTSTQHWTCKNGQDESMCRADLSAYRRSELELAALKSTTVANDTALLWRIKTTRLQSASSPAEGDRSTSTTFGVASDANTYRVRDLETTSVEHGASGTTTIYARSRRSWDASFRVPLTDETWFDADDSHRAVERRTYDMQTGNVLRRYKPVQNATTGTSVLLEYDSRKLLVARETNELGHRTSFEHQYGTGTRLVTRGPNVPGCALGVTITCPPGAPLAEEHRIRVDGLGRTIERLETFGDSGEVYRSRVVERTEYDDRRANGTEPTRMRVYPALDIGADDKETFGKTETEFDGHGRLSKVTVYTFGSAPADHVTRYQYRNDGTLRAVILPDPSANSGGTVVNYRYNFDSVGRPTEVIRPAATAEGEEGESNSSGVRISYDGLTKTTTEVVGAAGGTAARRRLVSDSFDRLVRVDEQDGADTWASTHYLYTPDDLISEIIDPEGVTTTLVHDLGGRRISIERAGRIWRYGYDRNGNMNTRIAPGSSGPLSDDAFTTSTAYDDLDRPTSKLIGQRNLSATDQATFASAIEQFTWDAGPNHVGRLRSWKTFGPGATTPAVSVEVDNNAQGQRTRTQQTLNLAGYRPLTRAFARDYYISGAPRKANYHDQVGGPASASTSSLITQDGRGLPSSIVVTSTGEPDQIIGVQTRNIAGLVTKRRTNVLSSMEFIESNWTYDELGRVRSQLVHKGPTATQVVRQDLRYFGNDNPRWLEHWVGMARRHFDYTYDHRYQITEVSLEGAAFFASYDYDKAGRFRRAMETGLNLKGSDVKPRDVSYEYAGADPEQLTSLRKPDGSTFASYEYDGAGNQTYRCEGETRPSATERGRRPAVCVGESLEMVYDGNDRLRRVTKRVGAATRGTEEYSYDNAGVRVVTVKRNTSPNKNGLIWWLDDTEAHYSSAGEILYVYSYLVLGTAVARSIRTASGSRLEFLFNGIGKNTLAAVDGESGELNAFFVYAPFGEIIESSEPQEGVGEHRRRMNDKFVDEVSELAYYGFRNYDRTSMLWTQADPLYRVAPELSSTEPRRANLYSFSLNNPVKYLDPDGRDSFGFAAFASNSGGMVAAAGEALEAEGRADAALGETSTTALYKMVRGGIAKPCSSNRYKCSPKTIDYGMVIVQPEDMVYETVDGLSHGQAASRVPPLNCAAGDTGCRVVKVIMGVLGVGAAAAGVVAFGPTVATSAANLFYRVMPFGAAMGLAHKACGPNASCGTLVNHLAQRLGGNAMTVQNLPGRTGNLPGYKYFEHVVLRLQSGMVLDPLEGRIFSSMQAFVSGTFTGPVNVFSPGFAALHTIVP